MKNRNELRISFSEYKKILDPSASYVIVEKSVDKHGQGDLRDMDDLGDVFRKKSTSRKLIYDVEALKWILVIKLKAEFENGFFKSAVSPFAMKDLKVYLWSSR